MGVFRRAVWGVAMLLVAVCVQILPGGGTALPDDPVEITTSVKSLMNCVKSSSTMKVRFAEVTMKSGVIFSRKLVSEQFLSCFEENSSPTTLSVSDFLGCAREAEQAGLQTFRFQGGVCTGYPNGLPLERHTCQGKGTEVLYTVLDAANPGASIVGLTVLQTTTTSISASWSIEGFPSACYNDSYSVNVNGNDLTVFEPSITVTGLDCGTGYTLRVRARDANGEDIGTTLETTATTETDYELTDNGYRLSISSFTFSPSYDDPCQIVDNLDVIFTAANGSRINDQFETNITGTDMCLVSTVGITTVLKNGTVIPEEVLSMSELTSGTWPEFKSPGSFSMWTGQNKCVFIYDALLLANSYICLNFDALHYRGEITADLTGLNLTGDGMWLYIGKLNNVWGWMDSSNVEAMDSSNWSPTTNPSDPNLDCAYYKEGKMFATNCNTGLHQFVCLQDLP